MARNNTTRHIHNNRPPSDNDDDDGADSDDTFLPSQAPNDVVDGRRGHALGPPARGRDPPERVQEDQQPARQDVLPLRLAGFWVGLGGIAALSVAGGIPVDVRNAWPFLPKLSIGLFFAFGESSRFYPCV